MSQSSGFFYNRDRLIGWEDARMTETKVSKSLNEHLAEDTNTLLHMIEDMSQKYPADSDQWKKLNSIWVSTETMMRITKIEIAFNES